MALFKCDRETHTHRRQTHDDGIYGASIASRGKKNHWQNITRPHTRIERANNKHALPAREAGTSCSGLANDDELFSENTE